MVCGLAEHPLKRYAPIARLAIQRAAPYRADTDTFCLNRPSHTHARIHQTLTRLCIAHQAYSRWRKKSHDTPYGCRGGASTVTPASSSSGELYLLRTLTVRPWNVAALLLETGRSTITVFSSSALFTSQHISGSNVGGSKHTHSLKISRNIPKVHYCVSPLQATGLSGPPCRPPAEKLLEPRLSSDVSYLVHTCKPRDYGRWAIASLSRSILCLTNGPFERQIDGPSCRKERHRVFRCTVDATSVDADMSMSEPWQPTRSKQW